MFNKNLTPLQVAQHLKGHRMGKYFYPIIFVISIANIFIQDNPSFFTYAAPFLWVVLYWQTHQFFITYKTEIEAIENNAIAQKANKSNSEENINGNFEKLITFLWIVSICEWVSLSLSLVDLKINNEIKFLIIGASAALHVWINLNVSNKKNWARQLFLVSTILIAAMSIPDLFNLLSLTANSFSFINFVQIVNLTLLGCNIAILVKLFTNYTELFLNKK